MFNFSVLFTNSFSAVNPFKKRGKFKIRFINLLFGLDFPNKWIQRKIGWNLTVWVGEAGRAVLTQVTLYRVNNV